MQTNLVVVNGGVVVAIVSVDGDVVGSVIR